MYNINQKIGKIIKIDGTTILIEITEKNVANKLTIRMGTNSFPISINKMIFTELPNNKKVVGRISKIYDKSLFEKSNIYDNSVDKFLVEVELIGIYDDFLKKFDSGLNTFPIIGSDVFYINESIQSAVVEINSKYKLEIGKSYNDSNLSIYTNPDVLFGKHLAIFGNTGTGKSCTIASLIQGLKRRLSNDNKKVESKPKIIIFDSNSEYERAFNNEEFKVKVIKKEDLRLPHYELSFTEFYKLLNASQGVQMPVLKSCIQNLKDKDGKFKFSDLPDAIENFINEKVGSDKFSKNQWLNYTNIIN